MRYAMLLAIAVLSSTVMAQRDKAQVMILGTYHMHNPGRDMVKADLDDHLSPKRQEEIQEVLDRLVRYRPTRILVEIAPDNQQFKLNYSSYLKDQFPLTANEVHQIGFKLGRRLGHGELYPVDSPSPLDMEKVLEHAKRTSDRTFLEYMDRALREVQIMMQDIPNRTVREALLSFNSPGKLLFASEPYIMMARVSSGSEYPGADLVADWYRRNLKIYANMAKVIRPADKVLLIIGSGHAPILREFVRNSPDMELVEPSDYLK